MARQIVIIGNGIAGITCARHLRKTSKDPITIISAETQYFYSRTALMYIYMGQMKYEHTKPFEDWFWEKNRLDLVQQQVTSINPGAKQVQLQDGQLINFDVLVLATGSISNWPAFKGIDLNGVQSLYGIPDLLQMQEHTKHIQHAVIIGGGLIGIEMAEMLLSREISVTFLIREQLYWDNVLPAEEAAMVSEHIKEHHVDLRQATELDEIIGNEEGAVVAVRTKTGQLVECGFVGITVGVSPNISLAISAGIETGKGILVNEYFETSVAGIYAIGDCAEQRNPPAGRKAVEQVWYTGRIHGETLALTLSGKPAAYNPAPWFNSAKFFDIEYQTYGRVDNILAESDETFYWQHPTLKICFRVVYQKSDETVVGFNALGMRLRHEVCNDWLQKQSKIEQVMADLRQLNFDPEFYDRYEQEIISCFNQQKNKAVKLKKQQWFSLTAH